MLGIDVQYPMPHLHFQNGLAKVLIKRIQWIAQFLLMQSKLPPLAWGHAILYDASLFLYPHQCSILTHLSHQIMFGNLRDLKFEMF